MLHALELVLRIFIYFVVFLTKVVIGHRIHRHSTLTIGSHQVNDDLANHDIYSVSFLG